MTKEEDVVKETLYILNYFNSNFVAKIPNNFLEKLKKIAKTSKINVNIDKSTALLSIFTFNVVTLLPDHKAQPLSFSQER